jgi:uncharacterized membrane protein YhaH (DUF805 family)
MGYMLMPLRRYADFTGRSQRQEYWMFALLQFLLLASSVVLSVVVGMNTEIGDWALTPLFVVFLATFLPALAVQIRRFHDQDRSGWMMLLALIPYVGGLVVLVFMCFDGTPGDNRFGPDPKGRGSEKLVEIFN